jgi:hypothetical protein
MQVIFIKEKGEGLNLGQSSGFDTNFAIQTYVRQSKFQNASVSSSHVNLVSALCAKQQIILLLEETPE